jgi:hypothetical protein
MAAQQAAGRIRDRTCAGHEGGEDKKEHSNDRQRDCHEEEDTNDS